MSQKKIKELEEGIELAHQLINDLIASQQSMQKEINDLRALLQVETTYIYDRQTLD